MNQVVPGETIYTVDINIQPPVRVEVVQPQVAVTAVSAQGPRGAQGPSGTANSFITAGDGLAGGGPLTANVSIAVDSTVVRANGVLWLDYANSRVGINQSDPKIDLHIGVAGMGTYTSNLSSSLPNQIIDTWSAADFRSAKYHIQLYAPAVDEFEISEVFMLHNNGEVYLTEYAVVNQGIRLAQYSASIYDNEVRLLCSPTYGVSAVNVFRTVMAA
jgi:hypothetical protein